MKKTILVLFLIIVPILVTGCKANVVGKYDDYNEIFTGVIDLDLQGSGYIEVTSEPSKIKCKGYGELTYVPFLSQMTGMCKGQRGIVELRCSDGRNVSGEWVCKKFVEIEGNARTDNNELITFYIEKSKRKAQAKKEQYIKETTNNPPLGYKFEVNKRLYDTKYNLNELL